MKLPRFIVSNQEKKIQRAEGANEHTHARACTNTHTLINTFSNDLVTTLLQADASI